MTNKLLAVIAVNLTILTALMVLQYITTANAQSGIQKIALCDRNAIRCADVSNGVLQVSN